MYNANCVARQPKIEFAVFIVQQIKSNVPT